MPMAELSDMCNPGANEEEFKGEGAAAAGEGEVVVDSVDEVPPPPPQQQINVDRDEWRQRRRPHVVVLAWPPPGHKIPALELVRQLAARAVQVTVAWTGDNSQILQHEVEEMKEQQELDITFRTLVADPVPEPPGPLELGPWLQKLSTEEMVSLMEELVRGLNPPPCCIIGDVYIPWARTVAANCGIQHHYLTTMSAASLALGLSAGKFLEEGLLPVDPLSESTDLVVPGLGVVKPCKVWEYWSIPQFKAHEAITYCFKVLQEAAATSTILVNSCQELEQATFEALQTPHTFPFKLANVVPVGPLLPPRAIHNQAAAGDSGEATRESKGGMKKIGKWLDAQPPRSVVYISFGSIFSPTVDQIKELAQGLEASEQRFLWVLRHPDHPHVVVSKELKADEIDNLLPPGFQERTRGRGLVLTSWAPQLEILAHKATGLYLSHCGWNSTLEAICAGVPLLTCPCFVDQWMNASWIVEAGCGMVLMSRGNFFDQGIVEKAIRGMLEGEEGKLARARISHLNRVVYEAVTTPSGSSMRNIHQYVDALCTLDVHDDNFNAGPAKALLTHSF